MSPMPRKPASSGGASLLFETLQTFRVIGIGGRKYFDRDCTAEARVTGATYFTHPFSADGSQGLIWAEPSAFRELHNSTAYYRRATTRLSPAAAPGALCR